jgi:hypothetical protein
VPVVPHPHTFIEGHCRRSKDGADDLSVRSRSRAQRSKHLSASFTLMAKTAAQCLGSRLSQLTASLRSVLTELKGLRFSLLSGLRMGRRGARLDSLRFRRCSRFGGLLAGRRIGCGGRILL